MNSDIFYILLSTVMNTIEVAKELISKYINEDGSIKQLTGWISREIEWLFKDWEIEVSSLEDLKDLSWQISTLDGLSGVEKLWLQKLADTYIAQYPEVVKESFDKKETKDREQISTIENNIAERKNTRKKRWIGEKNSSETLSDHIDAAYLDELATTEWLHPKHIEQLGKMKDLLATNSNCTIDKTRLTVKDWVLLIDGYTVPSDLVDHSNKPAYKDQDKWYQRYDDMKNNPKEFLYAEGFFKIIQFIAELWGNKFSQWALNSDNLTNWSLWYEDILSQLRSWDNNKLLWDLSTILWLNWYFPIGLDKEKYVIYAGVRPDSFRCGYGFSRDDSNDCLASSQFGG